MRKFSIILIVIGVLLFLSSTVVNFSNLSRAYKLAGESLNDTDKSKSLTEIETRKQIANYTRIGMYGGLAVLIVGVVLFRINENRADKAATKKKLVY